MREFLKSLLNPPKNAKYVIQFKLVGERSTYTTTGTFSSREDAEEQLLRYFNNNVFEVLGTYYPTSRVDFAVILEVPNVV